jgi:hypothetical protein
MHHHTQFGTALVCSLCVGVCFGFVLVSVVLSLISDQSSGQMEKSLWRGSPREDCLQVCCLDHQHGIGKEGYKQCTFLGPLRPAVVDRNIGVPTPTCEPTS